VVLLAGLFGLLIGSFLNVVVWRLPRGESLSHPASHCPTCGHPIRAYDNIPVFSWVLLRGSCRDCGARISPRYPLVELATGAAFAATAAWVGWSIVLPFALWFVAASIAMILIDVEHHRLPNSLTLSTYAVVVTGLAITAMVGQEWHSFGRAIFGGLGLALVYAALAMAFPKGMGWGDVKLALVVGTAMAWVGWDALVVGGFGAFLLGAVWGVASIATGRAGRKSALPFGPFMVVAAIGSMVWGSAVATWYSDLFL
jgi:leader peptidase (prepilin peptidase)/N-methyltransferase